MAVGVIRARLGLYAALSHIYDCRIMWIGEDAQLLDDSRHRANSANTPQPRYSRV